MSAKNELEKAARAAFFGDWHGDLLFAQGVLNHVYETEEVQVYLQAGDFELWRDRLAYLDGLEALLAKQGRYLFWVDGNHDDFGYLKEFPLDENGLRQLREHIYHLPRGLVLTLGKKRLLSLGGAYSINRPHLTEGLSWFPEELITPEEAKRAAMVGKVDIFLTHEAPTLPPMLHDFGGLAGLISGQQQAYLQEVARSTCPGVWLHGHHHVRYEAIFKGSLVIGLGKNQAWMGEKAFRDNYVVLDVIS